MIKGERAVVKVDDDEGWQGLLSMSETRLVVVDCYEGWCGMCDAMQPILQKSLQDYQDVDSRLVLAAANIDNLGEQVMAVLPSDTKFNLEKNGCQPLFLLLRSVACVAVVHGSDGPVLLQHISNNIPERVQDDE